MPEVDALNAVLGGEYAAIYAYGVIAAHLTGAEEKRALAVMADHRQQRDKLRAAITEQGGTPVAAAALYELPAEVTSAKQARDLAGLIEDRLSGLWAAAAAAGSGERRTAASLVSINCSVRSTSWTGEAPVWPGAV
jgi:hypothetical protein